MSERISLLNSPRTGVVGGPCSRLGNSLQASGILEGPPFSAAWGTGVVGPIVTDV